MAIDNTPRLVPHLVVDDAAAAIDFYIRAFNATEEVRLPGPDGKLMHACMTINGAQVFLNDDFPNTTTANRRRRPRWVAHRSPSTCTAPMSKADSSRRSTPAPPS